MYIYIYIFCVYIYIYVYIERIEVRMNSGKNPRGYGLLPTRKTVRRGPKTSDSSDRELDRKTQHQGGKAHSP